MVSTSSADYRTKSVSRLVVGRERFFLSEKGKAWKEWKEHGIEFPEVTLVPMTAEGTADTAKGKKARLVPHYLYFADVDNDGDVDAPAGVHSNWEVFDGRGWKVVKECDHGVRSAVWLNDGTSPSDRTAPDSSGTGSPDRPSCT